MPERTSTRSSFRCSLCGKHQDQVERLIAGPGPVFICNECIALSQEVISSEHHSNE